MNFAGSALLPALTRAMAHISVPDATPRWTIDVWDSESTGTAMPRPPWGDGDYLEHGRIRGYFGNGLYAVYSPGGRVLSVLDTVHRRGWYWLPSLASMPVVLHAGPFHSLLHLVAASQGQQYVHAAAVGSTSGCVLVVGSGGRGKSSTALACLEAGMGYLGDDYCLIEPDGPTVWSLSSSAKLDVAGLQRLPSFGPWVVNRDRGISEKAIFFVQDVHVDQLLLKAPLRAIAVPQVVPELHSKVRPASRGAAFAALAPSTLLQLAGADASTMRGLRDLAGSVPTFRLDVGSSPASVAAAVASLL